MPPSAGYYKHAVLYYVVVKRHIMDTPYYITACITALHGARRDGHETECG